MENTGMFLLAIVLMIVLLVIPLMYGVLLWLNRPILGEERKLTVFWKKFLWCCGFFAYGIFTVYTSFDLAFSRNLTYSEEFMAVMIYVLP